MATKQTRKTTPNPTPATETKAKTKAKPKARKPAEAPDTKTKTKTTAREAAGTPTKATRPTRRKPAEAAATKAKGTWRKLVPAAGTKTSRRRPAGTHRGEVRKPESNGLGAEHAGATALSSPGDETATAEATTPGTQRKAARSQQVERIFLNLFEALDAHAKSQGIGHVAQDAQFDWGEVGNQELQPDLAFISFDRWAAYRHVPKGPTWHVVPDLVVEIIRRSEQTEPISAWLEHYFHAGVNRVWVVYPDQLKIHDHGSLSSARVLDRDQSLDGGSILPGFQLPLKELLTEPIM
jgi:Uma2 family endonuclease